MKIKKRLETSLDVDYTPMIDMTFQLIAFFMILINFDASEQDERIQLPSSELAKPAKGASELPIFINLTKDGRPVMGGSMLASVEDVKSHLQLERQLMQQRNQQPTEATVIIRSHQQSKTGVTQRLIQICQENGFEKFVLRAKEEVGF